ncbi:uncharacterized protein LOC126786726 [Argentina anserina]|uniref:uncharacterized protein LOC126786726 n=1 Tax=Argentina anserina TaxID=57926 RepID=UPI0021767DE9|nr:uncharacterized protein LOC126786726 [Potentilla anserina]
MPQDLPGFYYDAEKNRYFPNKGPVPGSRCTKAAAASSSSSDQKLNQVANKCKRTKVKTSKLLQARELYGNVIAFSKGRCNFKEEFLKAQASHPVVWKYLGTKKLGDAALERINIEVQTGEGLIDTDFLLAGGRDGSLRFFALGEVGQGFHYGEKCLPDLVWPLLNTSQVECRNVPGHICSPLQGTAQMPSSISSIKTFGKHSTENDGSSIQNALVSTLGAEDRRGSLFVINLTELLDFRPNRLVLRSSFNEVATFNCTVWTSDCRSDGSCAVIGTNAGAASVDLETGVKSWLLHSKSDVLAQQLVHSGNVVLCGLRNGAIVTVDVREKQKVFSARHASHIIQQSPLDSTLGKSRKQWFKLSGNIHPSHTIKLPSSIACLVSLQFDDQYFLASSMDGTIKLYDHRIIQRGAVQTYEGHVNSHTRLQLGVDPSERFFISGGEDCNLRLWSIKSGELLFEDKLTNTVTSTVCWQKAESFKGLQDERQSYDNIKHDSLGAWLGSMEGIFYMDWEL